MQIILHPYTLQLRHYFKIARDERSEQPTLIVELRDGDLSGFGEATTNPYYGISYDNMRTCLQKAADYLLDYQLFTPERLWEETKYFFLNNPFAQCALDEAVWDLYGRKKKQPLYQVWGLDLATMPQTNYTIGIDTVENMVKKLQEMPWDLYKIKLGTEDDLLIIRELRKHTSAVFRVDANCGWTPEQTIKNSFELKKLGVEFIEQPLRADNWEGMKEVYQHSELPLIADESCIVETDVEQCAGYFHGINIKLMKCGGITPARRMIEKARQLGLKLMVGCMTESTVGVSAIAHLAPLLDYVDMDGPLLLSNDIASGVQIKREKLVFATENGTGVQLLEATNN
ncbi:MAG: dipeptide epimerase [Microscillaceae bacterium]|jgi:L-alanine-DL-glutamate epimerase-like enolase superfamily enzyme|nr:dipeptide epimerase [Microscillaceae bacterium]